MPIDLTSLIFSVCIFVSVVAVTVLIVKLINRNIEVEILQKSSESFDKKMTDQKHFFETKLERERDYSKTLKNKFDRAENALAFRKDQILEKDREIEDLRIALERIRFFDISLLRSASGNGGFDPGTAINRSSQYFDK